MIEVVQKNEKQPLSYCYHCRHLMKEGELVESISIPIAFRNGKAERKAKAEKFKTHLAHERCVRRRSEV